MTWGVPVWVTVSLSLREVPLCWLIIVNLSDLVVRTKVCHSKASSWTRITKVLTIEKWNWNTIFMAVTWNSLTWNWASTVWGAGVAKLQRATDSLSAVQPNRPSTLQNGNTPLAPLKGQSHQLHGTLRMKVTQSEYYYIQIVVHSCWAL